MADFKTHLTVATVAGGLGSTSLLVAERVSQGDALVCFVAAILGGILPDIDADNSTPLNIAFTLGAIVFSFLVMFGQTGGGLSVVELVGIWLVAFLFFKSVIFKIFTWSTVHRGIFHSLPAGVLFGFIMAIWLTKGYAFSGISAWLAGGFLFFGFVIHLLLDEIYSLNLLGVGGVKNSFGTAFKLYSSDPLASAFMYGGVGVLFLFMPESQGVVERVMTPETWGTITSRFLPSGSWYGWGAPP
ncbi:MAG: metal-dependent hydrolase [Magnetococcales bacterium]|nr:metal-dependent hydrolase [Magnetococcales bacterium]